MTEKRYKHMCNDFGKFTIHSVFDTETKGTYGDDNYQKIVDLLNKQDQKIKELTKENKKLKSDLAIVIEQASKNDKFLRSDIRILENALWCPNCANDIKRLKELRKEFLK